MGTLIFVPAIEAISMLIGIEGEKVDENTYRLGNSDEYDPLDLTLLLKFIPGDVVTAQMEKSEAFNGNIVELLVAKETTALSPERKKYMLMYLIAEQQGYLTREQDLLFQEEIESLKAELNDPKKTFDFHPSILRWYQKL